MLRPASIDQNVTYKRTMYAIFLRMNVPFWNRVDTFWNQVDAFWNRVDTFWTRAVPFWNRVVPFWNL